MRYIYRTRENHQLERRNLISLRTSAPLAFARCPHPMNPSIHPRPVGLQECSRCDKVQRVPSAKLPLCRASLGPVAAEAGTRRILLLITGTPVLAKSRRPEERKAPRSPNSSARCEGVPAWGTRRTARTDQKHRSHERHPP